MSAPSAFQVPDLLKQMHPETGTWKPGGNGADDDHDRPAKRAAGISHLLKAGALALLLRGFVSASAEQRGVVPTALQIRLDTVREDCR